MFNMQVFHEWLSSALACAQIGILLVDDMPNSDPRGEYRRISDRPPR